MLLDTSGLLCLHHRAEPFHDAARAAYKQAATRLIPVIRNDGAKSPSP